MSDAAALRDKPKAELHIHLDGSVRPATVEELTRTLGIVPADAQPGTAMQRVRVRRRAGLAEALAGFAVLLPLLQTRDHLTRVTHELIDDLADDGVTYAELRFCPRLSTEGGLSIDEVLDTVAAAAHDAGESIGVRCAIIACLMGGVDPGWNAPIVEAAARAHGQGVVAVDLAGPVEERDDSWVAAHERLFARAREAGLRVTIHAGEAEPAAAIRTALDRYFAERIGHGTSLGDDPDLLAEVVERGVIVECCPRSNYWTRLPAQMPGLEDHPVGAYLRKGVRACLNTDDRTLFGNDLSGELAVVAETQGLSDDEVDQLIRNGFAGAFA